MTYQALYRVWRPQTFEDVVGQNHVTKTLKNALINEKISHAYLFTGPRGTGKTSAAKILAKAVNCTNPKSGEPCNECDVCKGITDGSIPDIIEIDAASNNGVEEIRDIRDKVKYAPSVGRYKVYIVDEVHMLSVGAFNALLKTLEEPPEHVIFILATTEPQKIPLTIISRCQRFDFKRIPSQTISDRMKYILNDYGYEYEDGAVQLIARAAEGGMRDALSLLDQAISYGQNRLTIQDVLLITGSISQKQLNDLALAILNKEPKKSIKILHNLLEGGKETIRILQDLIEYFRDLLLYKSSEDLYEYMERVVPDEEFASIGEKYGQNQIYEIIEKLNQTEQEIKWTNNAKTYLEVCLVQLCQKETFKQESGSDKKIAELELKVRFLENELQELKSNGKQIQKMVTTDGAEQKPASFKPPKNGIKFSTGKIENILSKATKQNLHTLKSNWGNLLEGMKKSHAALLNDAEPAAASDEGCIIKFKYEIHCQMALTNQEFIQTLSDMLSKLFNQPYEIIGIPEEQWTEIRTSFLNKHLEATNEQNTIEKDPIIEEARKLVGEDLLEIKD